MTATLQRIHYGGRPTLVIRRPDPAGTADITHVFPIPDDLITTHFPDGWIISLKAAQDPGPEPIIPIARLREDKTGQAHIGPQITEYELPPVTLENAYSLVADRIANWETDTDEIQAIILSKTHLISNLTVLLNQNQNELDGLLKTASKIKREYTFQIDAKLLVTTSACSQEEAQNQIGTLIASGDENTSVTVEDVTYSDISF